MKNLPDIKIEIHGISYDNTFAQDVQIDRTHLDEEFSTQAEKYAYYAFLAVEARSSHDWKKFELERLYAVIDHEKRVAAMAMSQQNKAYKYTEKMCENEVITDKRYVAKREEIMAAERLWQLLDQAARAISQRRDMLMQLGANNRTGMAPTRVMEQTQSAVREIVAANRQTTQPFGSAEPTPPPALPEPTIEYEPDLDSEDTAAVTQSRRRRPKSGN